MKVASKRVTHYLWKNNDTNESGILKNQKKMNDGSLWINNFKVCIGEISKDKMLYPAKMPSKMKTHRKHFQKLKAKMICHQQTCITKPAMVYFRSEAYDSRWN